MTRTGAVGIVWLALVPLAAPAQAPTRGHEGRSRQSVETEEKGTFLGALFGPVAEALYDQVPTLPRDQGVLVTHVLPDSPAARAGLRRHDILLRYDGEAIRGCEHLARHIQNDRPERTVRLALVRAGKETTLDVTLATGPVLKLAQPRVVAVDGVEGQRGPGKPGPPAPVNVAATPLEHGKMKVTVEYYPEGGGRPRTLTCEGSRADIDGEIQKLPERERQLARVALQRIRDLISSKPTERP